MDSLRLIDKKKHTNNEIPSIRFVTEFSLFTFGIEQNLGLLRVQFKFGFKRG